MLVDMVILSNSRSISLLPRATTEIEVPGFLPTDYDHLRYDTCKQKQINK